MELAIRSDVVGTSPRGIFSFGVSHVRICADHSVLPAR